MAKPYSTSHIGFVSSGFTDMRLSGAVKEQLVEMLVTEIDQMVPAMEAATLSATPDKKTLDDTNRTRLNYNRTRELMIAFRHGESITCNCIVRIFGGGKDNIVEPGSQQP